MSNSDSNVTEQQDIDFGSVLAEARKAQNYTVDEICEQLKIPVHVIAAIERNDLDVLPPPTFTQGYIRAYARFLEISEESVIAAYNRAVPRENQEGLKPRSNLRGEASSQSPLVKTMTMLLIFAGLAAVVYGSFQYYQEKAGMMESERETQDQEFSGSSLDSPGTTALSLKPEVQSSEPETELVAGEAVKPSEADDASREESESAKTVISAAVTDEVNESEENAGKTAPLPDTSVIEIFAENGSWMEVRDASGARLFYNMVPKGGSKTFQGQQPFRISLGNARTTRIVINGVEIDMTKYIRSNNTAKFTVSTKEQNVIFH